MGNVIKFPTNYVPDHPPEAYPDDIRAKEIAEENIAWCEELAEKLMYACLKNLQNNGVNIADKTTVGQLTFLAECIKSVVYHEKSIPHPLQEIADHFVSIENNSWNIYASQKSIVNKYDHNLKHHVQLSIKH